MQGRDGMVLVGAGGGDLLTAVVVVRRRCCSLNASIVPTSLDNGGPVCVVFLLWKFYRKSTMPNPLK